MEEKHGSDGLCEGGVIRLKLSPAKERATRRAYAPLSAIQRAALTHPRFPGSLQCKAEGANFQ